MSMCLGTLRECPVVMGQGTGLRQGELLLAHGCPWMSPSGREHVGKPGILAAAPTSRMVLDHSTVPPENEVPSGGGRGLQLSSLWTSSVWTR